MTANGTMEAVNVRIRLDRGRRNAVGSQPQKGKATLMAFGPIPTV